ncbi:hypothetical protein BH11PAT4_BH11PAT4_0570 [soil metagenome]
MPQPQAPTILTKGGTYPATGAMHVHLVPESSEEAFTIELTEAGSEILVTSAVVLSEGLSDLSLTVHHRAPNTSAQVLVKTLATQGAKASFKGLLMIDPSMPGCSSYLTHQSLLFDQAASKSWPALEISNNQVKCSHAVTSRTITDTNLFYLRSRGLTVTDSRRLLTEAFLSDVTF